MTPADSLIALQILVNDFQIANEATNIQYDKKTVLEWIKNLEYNYKSFGSLSGLSIQYTILMRLIHDASENHKGKSDQKIVVPPIAMEELMIKLETRGGLY
jgi:hypothetical protein